MPLQGTQYSFLLAIVMLWSLFWKAIALWRAARSEQKYWFIVMLILNSVGILELVYLFRFAKKRLTIEEIQGWWQSRRKSK